MRQASAPSLSLEAGGFDLLAESTPEEIALQGEVQACVRSAVASLPKPEQLVTVLFYGRHYSYAEVSAILKIPLTTVKKCLYSARQKLKVQLQATLREASERGSRASDGAEGAEFVLVRWWSGVIRWVKVRQVAWQTRSSFG